MSVGAQPTNGVAKLFNKFSDDFYPKLPVPFGSQSLYEIPEKEQKLEGFQDYFKNLRNPKYKYR